MVRETICDVETTFSVRILLSKYHRIGHSWKTVSPSPQLELFMEELGTLAASLPRNPPPKLELFILFMEDLGTSDKNYQEYPLPQIWNFSWRTGVWRLIAVSPADTVSLRSWSWWFNNESDWSKETGGSAVVFGELDISQRMEEFRFCTKFKWKQATFSHSRSTRHKWKHFLPVPLFHLQLESFRKLSKRFYYNLKPFSTAQEIDYDLKTFILK